MSKKYVLLLISYPSALNKMLDENGRFAMVKLEDLASAERLIDIADLHFDAVVIDICQADSQGFEVCSVLGQRGMSIPIIILAGSCEELDIIRGLNAVANDYICQPYQPRELAARLKAHIRSFALTADAAIRVGPFIFRPATQKLLHSKTKRKINLTSRETKLLHLLYESDGNSVRREDLLRDVFGYNVQSYSHTLETHIYRLRQRIKAESDALKIIQSGRGCYRLDITSSTMADL